MRSRSSHHRSNTRSRRHDGFLLAEALVTMAIGAFLLVALGSLVRMVVRADTRAAAISGEIEASGRVLNSVARDLRAAGRIRWGGQGSGFVFSGGARRVAFALREPATGSIEFVTFAAQDGVSNALIRTTAELPPYASSASELPAGATLPVYTGRLAVRFAYFSRMRSGQEVLTDDWPLSVDMPSAVRIALVDPASNRIAVSLRVPLKIDAEPGCAAPRRAVCSYVENGEADALEEADLPREAVDANDPLGWMRYAR